MVKNVPAMQETWLQSLSWKEPLEKAWPPSPEFLPGEFHGHRSPWGHKELDTTEQLTLSCTFTERQWINRKQNVDQATLEKHLADT